MGIQGISNRLSFLLPVRSALQVDDGKCLSVKCVSMPIEARVQKCARTRKSETRACSLL